MRLAKDGQVIDLANENHINAFLASGWAEVKTSAATPYIADKADKAEDVKVEKKPATANKKKQEK